MIIDDEQAVKVKSQFLDYEAGDGNSLILLSKLYKIDFHWLEGQRKYVACREEECVFCDNGYEVGTEYNYMCDLNGQKGFMNIKGSVFFAIQKISKAQKKNARQISWTVIKTGESKQTRYTTSKLDNIDESDYQAILDNLDTNTEKLIAVMSKQEEKHDQNYIDCFTLARPQVKKGKPSVVKEEAAMDAEQGQDEPEVNPNQIPF